MSMGSAYESNRNYDFGPSDRSNVSMLSPYVRNRQILESELIALALNNHSPQAVEKFIQEVFWRTYWKGWLELRPGVWKAYTDDLENPTSLDDRTSDNLEIALSGETGIDCFDFWVNELMDTGYLHNHARMWFASIWVHYLKLPWQRGADFFLRYLLDGDAASNTLSWRWVCGLQTKGKQYIASPSNIRRFTAGRFEARALEGLKPTPISSSDFERGRKLKYLESFEPLEQHSRILLVHDEDLNLEMSALGDMKFSRIVALSPELVQAMARCSKQVLEFRKESLADAVSRLSEYFGANAITIDKTDTLAEQLIELSDSDSGLVAMAPGVGYFRTLLEKLVPQLKQANKSIYPTRRDWDEKLYPHAAHGFFRFKKEIPSFLSELSSVSLREFPRAFTENNGTK